jgi:hypothetical protein
VLLLDQEVQLLQMVDQLLLDHIVFLEEKVVSGKMEDLVVVAIHLGIPIMQLEMEAQMVEMVGTMVVRDKGQQQELLANQVVHYMPVEEEAVETIKKE